MKHLMRPMLVVTMFVLGGQAIGFVTQIVIAAVFGARADMDAFLAANTLPQYLITVLLAALGFVFIPVFVEYTAAGDERAAWRVVNSVITLCLIVLGGLAILGVIFARPLLHWTTPGLSPASLTLAARVAMVTWPTLVLTGITSLLTGLYQALHRFGWSAAAPVFGALLNLALVAALSRRLGVIGLAIAALASLLLQLILLSPVLWRRFRFSLDLADPGVQQLLRLLWPLVLSSLFVRWTPVIDRYLASDLGEGAISHLSYAFKLSALCTALIATGITTVVFPRMALNSSTGDLRGLARTISTGLRVMWTATAPVLAIGAALAVPIVTTLLRRGQFGPGDAFRVGGLLRIYLLSLIAGTLGNITARSFYALKRTKVIAVMGAIEALGYAIYTPLLVRWLGAAGVALGYVIYFDLSLAWQFPLLRHFIGIKGGRTVLLSFLRTSLAAAIGGAVAWLVTLALPNPLLQLVLGGLGGFALFAAALWLMGSPEVRALLNFRDPASAKPAALSLPTEA